MASRLPHIVELSLRRAPQSPRMDSTRGLSRHLAGAQAALLVRISAATINRRLAAGRNKLLSLVRYRTKPGILVKSQIPLRT